MVIYVLKSANNIHILYLLMICSVKYQRYRILANNTIQNKGFFLLAYGQYKFQTKIEIKQSNIIVHKSKQK